jgi:hypothetical protein
MKPRRNGLKIHRAKHFPGQKHDVVVVNFLNRKNEADRRVFELLSEKFQLFEGVFGASDEVPWRDRIRCGFRETHCEHLPALPGLQDEIAEAERRQRKLRQEIFEIEGRIMATRDRLVVGIRGKLTPNLKKQSLFTIRWS